MLYIFLPIMLLILLFCLVNACPGTLGMVNMFYVPLIWMSWWFVYYCSRKKWDCKENKTDRKVIAVMPLSVIPMFLVCLDSFKTYMFYKELNVPWSDNCSEVFWLGLSFAIPVVILGYLIASGILRKTMKAMDNYLGLEDDFLNED